MTLRNRISTCIDTRFAADQAIALSILLIAGITAYSAYSLGLPGNFVLDDLVRFPGIRPQDATPSELIAATFQNLHGMFGRPLAILSFAITKATSGNIPAAFKYQNILLHLAVWLIQTWALAYILTGLVNRKSEHDVSRNPMWIPAACITAIWLIHPLFVSTVLYSVQRIAILAALFTWCAILCYTLGRWTLAAGRIFVGTFLLFVALPVFVLLGIGSKENATLLPVFFLLIHHFVKFPDTPCKEGRRISLGANIVFIALPILVASIYFLVNIHDFLSGYEFRPFSMAERLLTQGYLIWWYISLLFLPLLRRMTIYHDGHWLATIDNPFAYIALLSLACIGVLALLLRRKEPLLGFGIALFLASHIIESTIIPLELVFEHRNYMGAGGLFIAAYGLLQKISFNHRSPGRKYAAVFVTVAAFIILTLLLTIRAWTWSDNRKVVMIALEEHPVSLRAHVDAANYALQDNNSTHAAEILRNATRIAPHDAGAYLHLYTLKCEGTLSEELDQKIRSATRQRLVSPYAVNAFQNIGRLSTNDKCKNIKPEEALDIIRNGLVNPTLRPRFRYHLLLSAADLLASQENYPQALEYISSAIQSSKDIPMNQRHRALIMDINISLESGQFERMFENMEKLRSLMKHPFYQLAHPNLLKQLDEKIQSKFANST